MPSATIACGLLLLAAGALLVHTWPWLPTTSPVNVAATAAPGRKVHGRDDALLPGGGGSSGRTVVGEEEVQTTWKVTDPAAASVAQAATQSGLAGPAPSDTSTRGPTQQSSPSPQPQPPQPPQEDAAAAPAHDHNHDRDRDQARPRRPPYGADNDTGGVRGVWKPAAPAPCQQLPATQGVPLPPSMADLCGVVQEGVWPQVLQFYGAKRQPQLRLFVQSADPPGQPMANGPCEKLYLKEFHKRAAKDNPYAIKFAAELLVPTAVRKTRYAVAEAAEADLVLLEACIIGRGQQGQYIKDVAQRMATDPLLHEGWRRHGGSNYVLALTGDHGPCLLFRERAGKNDFFREKIKRWHDESIRNMTFLMNEGSLHGGCYDPLKDLTVPTTVINRTDAPPCETEFAADRRNFVFFSGLLSSKVRGDIKERWEGDGDFVSPQRRLNHEEFLCEMARSVFCLAPRGQAAWSPRLEESMWV